ncbi:hypothetical protein N8459_03370, partial [Nitrosopumilus sp.]|nr:hypothetical protein [Nitrosopumilus sp.]
NGLNNFIRDNAILMAVIFTILLISAYLNANFFKTLYHSMNNILYLSAKGTSDVVEPGLDQIQLLTKPEDYKRHLNKMDNVDSTNIPNVEYTPQQQAPTQQQVQQQVQQQTQQQPDEVQLAVEQPNVEGFSSLKPISQKSSLSKFSINP